MLEVDGIDTYYGDSQVLEDVSLSVGDGEVVGLLGRNGAGKTTTLRSIAGIQPPRAGRITFEGEDITGRPVPDIARRGIKLVPEDRRPFGGLTVRENLQLSVDTSHGDDWSVSRVFDEFERLDERSNQHAGDLSGGEQQMLVIAMALVGNPKLVLLDEPMEGLAPQIVDQIVDIIRRVKEADIPVLLIEQNVEICLDLIDRGYLLHKGEIRMDGSAAELGDATEEIERYLGVRV
ncbi:ABC transporter ATP-binding protein [Haloglomus litoreum]|uniref:ABC transporter ATP-binding protein n=1 Tax=Haloglomus litoreum TaxID=3034026 RepID=UPI0023E8B9AC|nr:ABC transporter ATP-binding protein [Haloglomus sp. DT116]